MKKILLLFYTLTAIIFADDMNPDKERIGLIADKPKFFFEKSIQFTPIGDTIAPIWPCFGLDLYVPKEKTEWGVGGTIGLPLILTRPGSKNAVYGVFSARAYGNYNINSKYAVGLGYEATKKWQEMIIVKGQLLI